MEPKMKRYTKIINNINRVTYISDKPVVFTELINKKLHSFNDEPSVIPIEHLSSQPYLYRQWHEFGKLHRINGPAVIWNSGKVTYYINGIKLSEKDWEQEVAKIKLKRILDL
jgi:hypothetical protein